MAESTKKQTEAEADDVGGAHLGVQADLNTEQIATFKMPQFAPCIECATCEVVYAPNFFLGRQLICLRCEGLDFRLAPLARSKNAPPMAISTDPKRFSDRLYMVTLLDVVSQRQLGTPPERRVAEAFGRLFDSKAKISSEGILWLEGLIEQANQAWQRESKSEAPFDVSGDVGQRTAEGFVDRSGSALEQSAGWPALGGGK